MMIKVNGLPLTSPSLPTSREIRRRIEKQPNLKKIAITLWIYSGILFTKAKTYAASQTGLWEGMMPMFQLFQEVAMVVGALAIMGGLVLLVFRKHWGITTIKISAIVVGGVFLVPAAVMLLAIVGGLFNERLVDVMKHMKH